jgi:hypothetical protein
MPTKRRFIIFLIVLTMMLLIKRAVGQEAAVGWDRQSISGGFDGIEMEITRTMVFGIFFGVLSGAYRVMARSLAARGDYYFSGDLIQLRLR